MLGLSSIRKLAPKHLNRHLLKINSPELLFKKSLKRRKRQRRMLRMAVKKTHSKSLKVERVRKMPPKSY